MRGARVLEATPAIRASIPEGVRVAVALEAATSIGVLKKGDLVYWVDNGVDHLGRAEKFCALEGLPEMCHAALVEEFVQIGGKWRPRYIGKTRTITTT